jgi:transcriptional regulator with XRE-family HTH domain
VTVQQCQEPSAQVDLPTLAIEVGGKSFVAEPGQGAVLIGRALPAQIRITSNAISRTHLRIEPIGQQWVVSDAGTRNGTFVDGDRIESVPLPVPLAEAFTLRLGAADGIAVSIRNATTVADAATGTVDTLGATGADEIDDHGDRADSDGAESPTGEVDLSVARAGAAVAARREELGLSQRKLADERIVSQSQLVKFERGEHWPRQSTLTKIEGYLDWPPGTIARIRAGANAPDAESTEVLSPTVQVAVLIDASEIALRVLLARAAGLPSTSAPQFGAEIAPLLSELRRLERTISGAAATSTGRPEIARLLSQIRLTIEELAGIASRAPGATLGQRLTAVRTRSRLSIAEVAAAAGTDTDTVTAAEAEHPLSAEARVAVEQFIAVVGAR